MRLTLKDHRDAMVAMLANGNCPTSAARIAHAMHDVLSYLQNEPEAPVSHSERREEATTPGLNDKLLALDLEAHRKPQTVNQLVRELEATVKSRDNTVKQLKENIRLLRDERTELTRQLEEALDREQCLQEYFDAGERLRVPDAPQLTQVHPNCRCVQEPVQSGVRKEDTELPDDGWIVNKGNRAVSGETEVEVRFVNGTKAEGPAADFGWSIGEHVFNIVAYRVVKP